MRWVLIITLVLTMGGCVFFRGGTPGRPRFDRPPTPPVIEGGQDVIVLPGDD